MRPASQKLSLSLGEDGFGDEGGGAGEGEEESGGIEPEPGQLSSGEWRDLDDWDFWRGLGEQMSPRFQEFHHGEAELWPGLLDGPQRRRGPHLEPSVGDYDVELFNDMLVRLAVEAME